MIVFDRLFVNLRDGYVEVIVVILLTKAEIGVYHIYNNVLLKYEA